MRCSFPFPALTVLILFSAGEALAEDKKFCRRPQVIAILAQPRPASWGYSRPRSYGRVYRQPYSGNWYGASRSYVRRSSYERRTFGASTSFSRSGWSSAPVAAQPVQMVVVREVPVSSPSPPLATRPVELEPPEGSVYLEGVGWIVPIKIKYDPRGHYEEIKGFTFPAGREVEVEFRNGQPRKVEYD